jgi:hypothetical protein
VDKPGTVIVPSLLSIAVRKHHLQFLRYQLFAGRKVQLPVSNDVIFDLDVLDFGRDLQRASKPKEDEEL